MEYIVREMSEKAKDCTKVDWKRGEREIMVQGTPGKAFIKRPMCLESGEQCPYIDPINGDRFE